MKEYVGVALVVLAILLAGSLVTKQERLPKCPDTSAPAE
jgi:hypothetical protein